MQRKLTTILSADVAAYSSLMEADEAGTVERLKSNRRDIFDPCVSMHGGRLFKLMGDGALIEFSSVVAAINCAVAIQEATEKAALSDATHVRYRIGINLGEMIVDGDDIYGEGVNVAARLQTLAPVGGVAVSQVVRDQVAGKVACAFEDLGEHTVKNSERPVRAFLVRAVAGDDAVDRKVGQRRRLSICVLPFANMSDDPQQEYFADGITEDIITDLSMVSALFVIARNTAFTFKGKSVDVPQVARQLKVSHVLEGSVRKAGGRVRITAQLVDGATGGHIWAERYDRDLNDIFALQDEISKAIVGALQVRLLPEEKKAIGQRGTDNVEAYNLYLMARQSYVVDNEADDRAAEAIIRLCRRATEIDPGYARAWTLMALGQTKLHSMKGGAGDHGLMAAERALALDANLAEAHAAKARILAEDGRHDEGSAEIAIALRLDPESYEVNKSAGLLSYRKHRLEDAIPYYEKATMASDINSAGMLISCYHSIGDRQGARRAAQIMLARAEKALARDQNNGAVVSYSVYALAALGEAERAKERMDRALLIEPDNLSRRYNFACALTTYLDDKDAAIELLGPIFAKVAVGFFNHAKADPDLDPLRDDPRFKAMVEGAEARLAEQRQIDPSPAP